MSIMYTNFLCIKITHELSLELCISNLKAKQIFDTSILTEAILINFAKPVILSIIEVTCYFLEIMLTI